MPVEAKCRSRCRGSAERGVILSNVILVNCNEIEGKMLRRFSLYGFLKNQQYYDYFLLLAFRQMGLSFFLIGVLIAFRQ